MGDVWFAKPAWGWSSSSRTTQAAFLVHASWLGSNVYRVPRFALIPIPPPSPRKKTDIYIHTLPPQTKTSMLCMWDICRYYKTYVYIYKCMCISYIVYNCKLCKLIVDICPPHGTIVRHSSWLAFRTSQAKAPKEPKEPTFGTWRRLLGCCVWYPVPGGHATKVLVPKGSMGFTLQMWWIFDMVNYVGKNITSCMDPMGVWYIGGREIKLYKSMVILIILKGLGPKNHSALFGSVSFFFWSLIDQVIYHT